MARVLPAVACKNPQTDSTVARFFRRFELQRILHACDIRKYKITNSYILSFLLYYPYFFRRSAFVITETELKDMASAATGIPGCNVMFHDYQCR